MTDLPWIGFYENWDILFVEPQDGEQVRFIVRERDTDNAVLVILDMIDKHKRNHGKPHLLLWPDEIGQPYLIDLKDSQTLRKYILKAMGGSEDGKASRLIEKPYRWEEDVFRWVTRDDGRVYSPVWEEAKAEIEVARRIFREWKARERR